MSSATALGSGQAMQEQRNQLQSLDQLGREGKQWQQELAVREGHAVAAGGLQLVGSSVEGLV